MRRRLVLNTILVAVLVLLAIAIPVVLLLKQATEDELDSRLTATAASISTTLTAKLATGDVSNSDLFGLVPDGDEVRVFIRGQLVASVGPSIQNGFGGVSSNNVGLRVEVRTVAPIFATG